MSIEENKALVTHAWDLYNQRELDAFHEIMTPEYVEHYPDLDMNLEQCIEFDANLVSAFPDFNVTLDDMVAEGNKVVHRWTFRGTHKGVFFGSAPSGKKITFTNFNITKIIGGKYVETWGISEAQIIFQQLGFNMTL